jgi:hypothetical protein
MSDNKLLETALSWLPFKTYRQIMPLLNLQPHNYMGTIIDPINPSTITVGGKFTNVTLNEKTDVGSKFKAEYPIVLVGSNHGEDLAPGYTKPEKKPKMSKRGRKPKPKEPKKRIQGTGLYFNSQITFEIMSTIKTEKRYKFKVYRPGGFQVPGVLKPDMSDINEPLATLCRYFSSIFGKPVEATDFVVQMRNCKTVLSDTDLTIDTLALGAIIDRERKTSHEMKISKVEYQTAQNSSKVVVKFSRPTDKDPDKQTTLKILKQKINFEGAVDFEGVNEIYWWLNDLLLDNYNSVINDPNTIQQNSDSSDTDSSDSESVQSEDENDQPKQRTFAFDPYNCD